MHNKHGKGAHHSTPNNQERGHIRSNGVHTNVEKAKTQQPTNERSNKPNKKGISRNNRQAKIRGQPKVHKDGHPMRLITCSRETILSYLSQYINL